jgi:hypothetical protein
MPTPTFQRVTLAQFQQLLEQFPFTRQIDAVHMHHTWRPRRADFRGHATILGMWRHHTQTNKWRDIAQHITIDPEGFIWLGRNWNLAPASAGGSHNGNSAAGPFMFEMVGDFDTGRDPFDGAQKATTLGVIAAVQRRFQLGLQSLRFHNTMSSKTCPGSGIDYDTVLAELQAMQAAAPQATPQAGASRSASRGPAAGADAELDQALRALTREPPPGDETNADESHDWHDHMHDHAPERANEPTGAQPGAAPDSRTRSSGLSAADLAALRPYLINLTAGRLSTTGETKTTVEDVDAIFEQHLPEALQAAAGQPLKLVFYAHGGLVSESRGLQLAQRHVGWWRRNGIYPVYFVWETGIFQILAELLGLAKRGRALDFPGIFDPAVEAVARAGGGVSIWGGMKANAQRAADAPTASNPIGGGAHYTAMKLQAFCAAHPGQVELYAVGHSAGAVFHAHFLPLARQLGVPTFRSAQFLAPAVRVDTFKDLLAGELGRPGGAAESLTVYTMQKDFERRDHCAHIYRKSLLYLIHHALEEVEKTPILGLEESLRGDPALKQMFGLAGQGAAAGAVVWSPSAGSQATAHGDFDDDAPTMNSVLQQVLGTAPVEAYPVQRSTSTAELPWADEVDWPDAAREAMALAQAATATKAAPGGNDALPASGAGRRTAVCVGIDAYPDAGDRLGGCVNDARHWSQALTSLGFQTRLLLNGEATRTAIDQSLRTLVADSRPGDVIVFQYAGHGTHVDDLDGDEDDDRDEALCPVDFRAGALYIDDDIAKVLAGVPESVNMTMFMDCCHSGTISRVAIGNAPRPPDTKARYVRPTPELQEAHRRFRASLPASRGGGTGGQDKMREVRFSACQDHQVALESNGSGEFTLRALRVLQAGVDGLSHDDFQQRLLQAFGTHPAQDPKLDCAPGAGARPLLQPLRPQGSTGPAEGEPRKTPAKPPAPATATATALDDARVRQAVHLLSQAIGTLTAPPPPSPPAAG